jgi:RNA polymerase sigma-70 factor (ECF subfamily)
MVCGTDDRPLVIRHIGAAQHRTWTRWLVNQQEGHPVATLSLLDSHKSVAPVGDRAVPDVRALTKRLALAIETKSVASLAAVSYDKGEDRNALVSAAVGGDSHAIDNVLRWIRPLVVRYCRSRVGGQEKTFTSADDVAQEVCLAVLTALPKYRDEGRPFLAFVYGIAGHKVADAHRSAARNRAEPVSEVPDATDLADGPEEQVMHGEIAGRMSRLLESLSGKQREIVHLRVVVGLSVEETAEAVGSTPGAVRVAQHRALNRLRAVLTSKPSADVAERVNTKAPTGRIADHIGSFTEWTANGRAVW